MTSIRQFFFSQERRKLFLNFLNYGLFQASNYIIPVITIPYIIRVVGLEKFGIISIAQGVANYLRVGVDYGWSILGVQYIARVQEDSKKKSEVVSNILTIQFLLTMIGIIILFLLSYIFKGIHKDWIVYFAAYGIVPANMMMTPWFYVGMERVKYLNYINLSSRTAYLILIFSFIHRESQYILVPIFNSFSILIAGIISIYLILFKFKIKVSFPNLNKLKYYFKDGWPIFTSYFATNFYRNSNILILAFFASKEVVGIFAAADKIVKVVQGTLAPITQTLYPYISRIASESKVKASSVIKRIAVYMALLSGFVALILAISSNFIMKLVLEKSFEMGAHLLQIGSGVILFGVLNFVVGIIYMTNFGMKRQFSRAVIITGFLNIIICFILSYFFSAYGAMLSFTLAEFILLILLLNYANRNPKIGDILV